LDQISKQDFIPSNEDILRARHQTRRIVERVFTLSGRAMRFFDVGGQRSERRKWIQCFDNVTSIIFLTAISEYDQVLVEAKGDKVNCLYESLQVFESICNNIFVKHVPIILFLNKTDLFLEKIKKSSIKSCFDDFDGEDFNYDSAFKFIEKKFLSQNEVPGKLIFTHPTCATDTDQIKKVFEACKLVLLRNMLGKTLT